MRFLHTSDWHLGRTMSGHSRREEQEEFLDWFVQLAQDRDVDAVVIAGDVYDRTVPSEDSVRMLNSTLVRLQRVCPVVIIPGNHDQAVRLGFAAELLENVRIHIRYQRPQSVEAIVITGKDGVVAHCYGLPYLDPDIERDSLGAARSHEDVLRKAMDLIRAAATDADGRTVVVAHAFIRGGAASDSERDLRVGGVGDAPVDVFEGIDYVALGHLHGAQTVSAEGSDCVVAYSGSPLAYSFSEQRHVKSVAVIDLPAEGAPLVELVPTPIRYPLATLTGTLQEIISDPAHEAHVDSWVRIHYTDDRAVANALGVAAARFNRIVEFGHKPPRASRDDRDDHPVAGEESDDPLEILEKFFTYATSSDIKPEEQQLMRDVYETVLRDGRVS